MTQLVSLTVPSSIQEFPLRGDSCIFVVGAWGGQHAQFYADTYNPYMYLFEPQLEKAHELEARFADNPKVEVVPYALGIKSGAFEMCRVGTDGCSFIARQSGIDEGQKEFAPPYVMAKMVEIGEFIRENCIDKIELCLMNCEGYEFYLLPWMIERGIIGIFDYLMVQFHLHHKGAERLEEIKKGMLKTHKVRDDYEPAWIVWEKR